MAVNRHATGKRPAQLGGISCLFLIRPPRRCLMPPAPHPDTPRSGGDVDALVDYYYFVCRVTATGALGQLWHLRRLMGDRRSVRGQQARREISYSPRPELGWCAISSSSSPRLTLRESSYDLWWILGTDGELMGRKTFHALFRPLSSAHDRPRRALPLEDNPAIQAIWHVVSQIPRGRVATYGEVARAAGLPGRARQTGYALRLMPEGMHLPWHRVVGAGGRIVFPAGSRSHREQARLLKSEGVPVKEGRVPRTAMAQLEGS